MKPLPQFVSLTRSPYSISGDTNFQGTRDPVVYVNTDYIISINEITISTPTGDVQGARVSIAGSEEDLYTLSDTVTEIFEKLEDLGGP